MTVSLDLQSTRQRLEGERDRLVESIARETGGNRQNDRLNPNRSDLAWTYIQRQTAAAQVARLERQLEKVKAALERLQEGDYGNCMDCGEPIDVERLKALPYATLCTRCQGKLER